MAWVRMVAEDVVRDRWLDSGCILKLEPIRFVIERWQDGREQSPE